MNAARAYYNEIDPYAAEWLRNLIAAGHITAGDVDERSIVDVRPADLAGYGRCHFFAGIGVWDYALGLAGWPADRPVWTGSCPCQPFSAAGRRAGFDDERHLWPVWFDLIRQCRPAIVLGEQVEAAVRLGWLDAVLSDLEGQGYACGATVFGAHSVGAPHIRQRLWFVADNLRDGLEGAEPAVSSDRRRRPAYPGSATCGTVADAAGERRHGSELSGTAGAPASRSAEAPGRRPAGFREPAGCGATGGVGNTDIEGLGQCAERNGEPLAGIEAQRWADAVRSGPWATVDWLPCRDGKARPVEPGLEPLAHGVAGRMVVRRTRIEAEASIQDEHWYNRVGALQGIGNAINAEAAAAFISACREVMP